jgi:hypothetical protein
MLRSNGIRPVAPRGGRRFVPLFLAVVAALACSGCFTAKAARVATAHDSFGETGTAWAREDGGIVIVTDAALGTFSMSPVVVDVPAQALEAAHQADGPYALDRSTLKDRDATSMDGLERVVMLHVEPGLGWTAEEVATLRPPGDATDAFFCGGGHSDFRVAHVRATGTYSGSGEPGSTVAVLEMQPAEEFGPWWSWPLVPLTLAAEVTVYAAAVAAVVVVGVASGLQGFSWGDS